MDIFSRPEPKLVNPTILKQFNKIIKNATKNEVTWSDNIVHFYNNYIKQNLFPLLVLIIVAIFLLIRYLLKQTNDQIYKKHKIRQAINNAPIYTPPQIINDELTTEIEEENDDFNINEFEREYQQSIEENDGLMSEQMIHDLYAEKSRKMIMNELSKSISGNNKSMFD